jgi:hypothetical protein
MHGDVLAVAIWLFVVGLALTVLVMRARGRMRRVRSLMRLADALGIEYMAGDVDNDVWQPFPLFGRGDRRAVEHVLTGTLRGLRVKAFDYWYREEGGERAPRTERFTCAVASLPASCPRLVVGPRHGGIEVMDVAPAGLPPFELTAFNDRFEVRSDDPRFAIAFVDQRMMEALLRMPPEATLATNEDRLLLVARPLSPTRMIALLHAAADLAAHAPRVVRSLYPLRPGFRPEEQPALGRTAWTPGHG